MPHPVFEASKASPKTAPSKSTPKKAPKTFKPVTLKAALAKKMVTSAHDISACDWSVQKKKQGLLALGTDVNPDTIDVTNFDELLAQKVEAIVETFQTSAEPFRKRISDLFKFWEAVEWSVSSLFGKEDAHSIFTANKAMHALEIALKFIEDKDIEELKEVATLFDSDKTTVAERLEEWCIDLMKDKKNMQDFVCEEIISISRMIIYEIAEEPETAFDKEYYQN